jgi:ABC-type Na+ efflux pump permease subunit
MRKILAIAFKDLRITFTDRNLLLLMLAAPVAVSTIIGVTFGGISSNQAPVQDIPVAIVNLDTGSSFVNYGAIMQSVLTGEQLEGQPVSAGIDPDLLGTSGLESSDFTCPTLDAGSATAADSTGITTLIAATVLTDAAEAKAAVDAGIYAVAVTIPEDFSDNLGYSPTDTSLAPVNLEIYADAEKPISVAITRSIVEQVAIRLAVGNLTLASLLDPLIDEPLTMVRVSASPAFTQGVACAFAGVDNPVSVEQQTIEGQQFEFNPLVVMGSAQAIFFALFTAGGAALSIIEENRGWTLPRLVSTPTPLVSLLAGKMLATFLTVIVQLILLVIALTLVNTILRGEFRLIWGNQLGLVGLTLIAVSLAAAGLGSIIAALSRTPEQASVVGNIAALFNAVVGGAFGFELPGLLQNLSIVYWGSDAFTQLANGQTDIGLNLLVLTVFGVITLGIGFYFFQRKIRA